ncbi:MAG: M23 family metallopeptidase, partial [Actinomycetota bacterium]|nr:M23 family metallopeptidase [Actinomycetota bacterium]
TEQPVRITAGAAPRAAVAPADGVFPVAGAHTYGHGIGAGRGHEGQDVFAKCGTPLVALFDATVQHKAFHSAAGNYVVLQTADGQSFAYMHLQSPSKLRKGAVVSAGDPVGKVGDTGRASGCHLHFEQWSAPGWYEGGEPVDPLPLLKSLDKQRR